MPDNINPVKVLILEDEPVIIKVVTRALVYRGMEVDAAENGLAAKEIIDSGRDFDLFLFDIRTPVINGMQLYEYMEENYPEAAAKVIFMTGDCLNTVTNRFLERVNRPVLAKPFTPADLMEIISRVITPELSPV
jgi:CheY-like chemotaxis protein